MKNHFYTTFFLAAMLCSVASAAEDTANTAEDDGGFAAITPPSTDAIAEACETAITKFCSEERNNMNMHRVADAPQS